MAPVNAGVRSWDAVYEIEHLHIGGKIGQRRNELCLDPLEPQVLDQLIGY